MEGELVSLPESSSFKVPSHNLTNYLSNTNPSNCSHMDLKISGISIYPNENIRIRWHKIQTKEKKNRTHTIGVQQESQRPNDYRTKHEDWKLSENHVNMN